MNRERKTTVLIVDDEPDVLQTLADMLRSFGHAVLSTHDAETALAMLRSGAAVDAVITDLSLPGLDGIGLFDEIRRIVPTVPVIMLTGHSSVDSFLRTQSRGIFEYINKPVRSIELRRIVQVAVQQSAQGRGAGSDSAAEV